MFLIMRQVPKDVSAVGTGWASKTYLMQTRGNTVDDFKALIVRVFIRFGEVSV